MRLCSVGLMRPVMRVRPRKGMGQGGQKGGETRAAHAIMDVAVGWMGVTRLSAQACMAAQHAARSASGQRAVAEAEAAPPPVSGNSGGWPGQLLSAVAAG